MTQNEPSGKSEPMGEPGWDPILDGTAAPHIDATLREYDEGCEVTFADGSTAWFDDYDEAVAGAIAWAKDHPEAAT